MMNTIKEEDFDTRLAAVLQEAYQVKLFDGRRAPIDQKAAFIDAVFPIIRRASPSVDECIALQEAVEAAFVNECDNREVRCG